MQSLTPLFILLCTSGKWAAPIDVPIRVELPVFDSPQQPKEPATDETVDRPAPYPPSGTIQASAHVGTSFVGQNGIFDDAGAQKLNAATDAVAQINLSGKAAIVTPQIQKTGLFSAPVTKLESAVLQTEGFESKPLSFKENVQSIVAGIFQPKPIVDTISEEDKYGNNGDKFYTVGRAVVGGAEGVSNLVNSVISVPSVIFKKITRAASEKLNNFGGKLIGLA